MQIPMTAISTNLPQVHEISEVSEIVTYESAKRIAWARLVDEQYLLGEKVAVVHIGTVSGKPAWADGYMMEVAEVPPRLSALKKFRPRYGPDDKPRDFDHLVPEITADDTVVKPLATILGEETGRKPFHKPSVTYLSDKGKEITIQTKYIDYFMIRYPDAQFIMRDRHLPLVVKSKGELVGMIMPIKIQDDVLSRVRNFLRIEVPELPVEPPVKISREQIMEMDYNHTLDELKTMARARGVSPSGTKHDIIKRLL